MPKLVTVVYRFEDDEYADFLEQEDVNGNPEAFFNGQADNSMRGAMVIGFNESEAE